MRTRSRRIKTECNKYKIKNDNIIKCIDEYKHKFNFSDVKNIT
jgi:hypothetical protein